METSDAPKLPAPSPQIDSAASTLAPDELASYEACTMLDTTFAVNNAQLLSSSDGFLQQATRSLATAPLHPHHQLLLPRSLGSNSWSVAEYLLDQAATAAVPLSFSSLGRRINTLTHHYASVRDRHPSVAEAATSLDHPASEWWHVEGFVSSYRHMMETSAPAVKYTRGVSIFNIDKPFPLQLWMELHQAFCPSCDQFVSSAGSTLRALELNDTNPCPWADIFSWLSGGWRLPLIQEPPPCRLDNHPSLLWSPRSMAPEAIRMREWGVLRAGPGKPLLIHPAMAVVRDGDLAEALRLLRAMGRRCLFSSKHDIDKINDHIDAVLSNPPSHRPEVELLKKVKIRMCIDTSKTLNPYLAHWPFSYCTVSDAVALLQEGWWMAKIDLEKFFNQLLLNMADWKYLGVNLDDLYMLIDELEQWQKQGVDVSQALDLLSAYAQFGVASFPALANALMAATSAILRAIGVPNCFLTDDMFICGKDKAECQERLDKAVDLLTKLGWRLQLSKVTPPSQQMVFLGIMIDTVACRLSIPANKLAQYAATVQAAVNDADANQLRYKDLESLVGKLNWVAEVMVAGRGHVRQLSSCLWMGKNPRRSYSHANLSSGAKEDLGWWLRFLKDPAAADLWVPFWTNQPPLFCSTFSDAAGDVGYSLVLGSTVYQGLWSDHVILKSSGYKELIPLLLAVQQLGAESRGRVVIMTTDNLGNVFAINKGSCKSEESYRLLARIFELAAEKQIYLLADWVPREHNFFPDAVSRYSWMCHK